MMRALAGSEGEVLPDLQYTVDPAGNGLKKADGSAVTAIDDQVETWEPSRGTISANTTMYRLGADNVSQRTIKLWESTGGKRGIIFSTLDSVSLLMPFAAGISSVRTYFMVLRKLSGTYIEYIHNRNFTMTGSSMDTYRRFENGHEMYYANDKVQNYQSATSVPFDETQTFVPGQVYVIGIRNTKGDGTGTTSMIGMEGVIKTVMPSGPVMWGGPATFGPSVSGSVSGRPVTWNRELIFHEIQMYNAVLSDAQMLAIHGALLAKWSG